MSQLWVSYIEGSTVSFIPPLLTYTHTNNYRVWDIHCSLWTVQQRVMFMIESRHYQKPCARREVRNVLVGSQAILKTYRTYVIFIMVLVTASNNFNVQIQKSCGGWGGGLALCFPQSPWAEPWSLKEWQIMVGKVCLWHLVTETPHPHCVSLRTECTCMFINSSGLV